MARKEHSRRLCLIPGIHHKARNGNGHGVHGDGGVRYLLGLPHLLSQTEISPIDPVLYDGPTRSPPLGLGPIVVVVQFRVSSALRRTGRGEGRYLMQAGFHPPPCTTPRRELEPVFPRP